jgi:hypothetical protein
VVWGEREFVGVARGDAGARFGLLPSAATRGFPSGSAFLCGDSLWSSYTHRATHSLSPLQSNTPRKAKECVHSTSRGSDECFGGFTTILWIAIGGRGRFLIRARSKREGNGCPVGEAIRCRGGGTSAVAIGKERTSWVDFLFLLPARFRTGIRVFFRCLVLLFWHSS